MSVNYIKLSDVEDAITANSPLVQVKCSNGCGYIGNGLDTIKEHIYENTKLFNCKCGNITKLNEQDVSEIKKLVSNR